MVCVGVGCFCVCACVSVSVCRSGDKLWELLLLPSFHCEFQGLDAGQQIYMQVSLPTEPVCCP